MAITDDHDNDIIQHWDHPIEVYESMTLYDLIQLPLKENRRLDLELEQLYEDKFLDSASGKELEKIAELVGTKRKTREQDDKFRKRIRAEFAAQASDASYESFATAMLSILGTNAQAVDIRTPPVSPDKVVEVEVDGSVIEKNPLSRNELASLLDRTVSGGARVDLIVTGTFAFAGDDSALEGWNEGTWSSTVRP